MTDLHTHILPGMDDGPKDLSSAKALLEQERLQGVHNIALTSHFHCEMESVDGYLTRREAAFSELLKIVPKDMTLKRGCEVFFTPELLSADPERLCLERTKYLLLELPILQKPAFVHEVLMGLSVRGITPVIAHAERYQYVRNDPTLLADWIDLGALIQVNAGSLTGQGSGFVLKLIKWGLVHILASDAHSASHRPANLERGLEILQRKLGAEQAQLLEQNASAIFAGQSVPAPQTHRPKKVLGFWF